MGVATNMQSLVNAKVSSIHYSKNLVLEKYTTCSMILNELHQIDLSQRIDFGSEIFRNGGHALHFHTNTRDLVFYDKIKDLEKAKISDKRAFEKDNMIQMSLFDSLNESSMQVLRMELRLGNRKEIQKILDKIGIKSELIFKNLFNANIAQKALDYFWKQIIKASYILNFKTEGVFELAETTRISGGNGIS